MTCKTKISENAAEYLYILLYTAVLYPAILKFSNIFFVDLRFQKIIADGTFSPYAKFAALGAALLFVILCRKAATYNNTPVKTSFIAALPLAGCGIMWFCTPTFPLLLLNIFLAAWSISRTAAVCDFKKLKQLESRQAVYILITVTLLCAITGTYHQYRSLNTLSMSWFDWGHFYECLNNFFRGKPFHLNLCNGSFLGSRFTPSLTLLLPVVATRSVLLFFFVSSLLTVSGSFFIYLTARTLKMSVNEALLLGIWYLAIPGTANMNLSLQEGFHEVFLLFPLVTAAVWCAAAKKHIAAAALVLLILGVRETTGILVAGYGIVLLADKQKKKGAALLACGIIYTVIVMKVLMPLFNPPVAETYAHVGFYSHLGNNIYEIMLSPFQKPYVFWSSLFNKHTILFWCTLILPFAALVFKNPLLLLPALPELIMVSVDRRFDSQTVLRHYQISIMLVLMTAALYGAQKLRNGEKIKLLFAGLKNSNHGTGALAFSVAAAVCSSIFFVRLPGLPASDPQRRAFNNGIITQWSDATGTISRIKSMIPAGSKVTAGAMIASNLIPDYDIYFNFDLNDKTLQDYVVIENFSSFYFPEAQLSRYLLTSANWQLIHQEFVDERSIQLFKRSETPVVKKAPLLKLDENSWKRAGQLIPLPITDMELRAVQVAKNHLRIGARIKAQRYCDAGFRTIITFTDKTTWTHFTSFCNGVYPADLAKIGDTFFYIVEFPADKTIASCRINIVELQSNVAPM